LTSALIFEKLWRIYGRLGRMSQKLLLSSITAGHREQMFHLVEAGKLESGL